MEMTECTTFISAYAENHQNKIPSFVRISMYMVIDREGKSTETKIIVAVVSESFYLHILLGVFSSI